MTDADEAKWSAGFTVAKALDTIVDEKHFYDTKLITRRLLAGKSVPYITEEESSFVRETYGGLSPETQARWHSIASALGGFALRRLEADTIEEYLSVTAEESQGMADILKVENGQEARDQIERENFNTWMEQMGRTAYAFDTLSDFTRDYNEGNTTIKPSLEGTMAIAKNALHEFNAFRKITPAPVYVAIGKRAVTKTFEKVQTPHFWRMQFMIKGGTL